MTVVTAHDGQQYCDDRNLAARQRLWEHRDPPFDLVAWVLELAGVAPGQRVLDVGCGNGTYLRALQDRGIQATGCDLSPGMLAAAAPHPGRVNADAVALPFPAGAFDVVLAPHMLYHVPDRPAAAGELRRVLRPGGTCVAVTNGAQHLRSLRTLVEDAVATPGWELRDPATVAFSLENGHEQLAGAFTSVACVRPEGVVPVVLGDAEVAAAYVASIGDRYEHEVTRPWPEIVDDVRSEVQRVIETEGAFTVASDVGAFVCR